MLPFRDFALIAALLAAGCGSVDRPASAPAPVAAPPAQPAVVEPSAAPEPPKSAAQAPPAEPAAPPPKAPSSPPSKSPPKLDTAPPAVAAIRAPTATPSPAPAARPQTTPALDLPSLEKRLRESSAIGVLTKLTLKNQVDDLVDRFRAVHEGRAATPLAELRQPYNLLIMKVLSLLQDKDPELAGAIAGSREALWTVLTDKSKFARI